MGISAKKKVGAIVNNIANVGGMGDITVTGTTTTDGTFNGIMVYNIVAGTTITTTGANGCADVCTG